jgi:hypothetical protein
VKRNVFIPILIIWKKCIQRLKELQGVSKTFGMAWRGKKFWQGHAWQGHGEANEL